MLLFEDIETYGFNRDLKILWDAFSRLCTRNFADWKRRERNSPFNNFISSIFTGFTGGRDGIQLWFHVEKYSACIQGEKKYPAAVTCRGPEKRMKARNRYGYAPSSPDGKPYSIEILWWIAVAKYGRNGESFVGTSH